MFERWFALDAGAYEIRLHDFAKHTDAKIRTALAAVDSKPVAFGQDAFSYVYQGPKAKVSYPIHEETVQSSVGKVLEHCFDVLETSGSLLKPCVLMAVPSWYTQDMIRFWQGVLLDAGIRKSEFVKMVDLLQTREPCFLVHAGHSYTEMGIYVNGTRRAYKKISFAGSRMDEQIKRAVATHTNCLIDTEDARALKHAASDAFWRNKNVKLTCMAMDRYQRLGQISVSAADLWPALEMVEQQIVLWAKQCFKEQPFEMKEELLKTGIRLSGGLAHCFGLQQLLGQAFSCPVKVTKTPEYDVINALKEIRP